MDGLPDYLRAPQTAAGFKKGLKTFLVSRSYELSVALDFKVFFY